MPFKSKSKRAAYHRVYRAKNAEKIHAKDRAYRSICADAERARFRQNYLAHGDELLARRRQKYATDPEHRTRILASNRASWKRLSHTWKRARHGTA